MEAPGTFTVPQIALDPGRYPHASGSLPVVSQGSLLLPELVKYLVKHFDLKPGKKALLISRILHFSMFAFSLPVGRDAMPASADLPFKAQKHFRASSS